MIDQESGDDETDSEDHTIHRNVLSIRLCSPIVANSMMVKLINQENLMEQLGDPHSWPNIDMQAVLSTGQKIMLPSGILFTPVYNQ
jgi:hypothetical protein